MVTIRRKTTDPAAAAFLKYAREQGIDLSWNNYERSLPLDGFARLGLSAYDLICGPSRLSPFDRELQKTPLGEDRDDLVYRTMMGILGEDAYYTDDKVGAILSAAAARAEQTPCGCDCGGEAEIGPGVLDADQVNILTEDVSCERLDALESAAEKSAAVAKAAGAGGFKIVTVGALCPGRAAAGSYTDAEFAVLTGLADAYILGSKAPGLGRNAAPHYATAVMSDRVPVEEILKRAAEAFGKRVKVRPCESRSVLKLYGRDSLKEIAAQYEKIVIVAGGASLRLTSGETAVRLVRALTAKGVACFTFGCAAIAAAKAGLTEHVYASGSLFSEAAGCAGIAEKVRAVCVPEISSGGDVARALCLGEKGFPVLTACELPIEGSIALSEALHRRLSYCKSADFTSRVLELVK